MGCHHIAAILSENIGQESLTASEKRILEMIVGGQANKEIAHNLKVTENTHQTRSNPRFQFHQSFNGGVQSFVFFAKAETHLIRAERFIVIKTRSRNTRLADFLN